MKTLFNVKPILFLITTLVLSVLISGLITACTTATKSVQQAVQVGMDKAAVLEVVGNPTRISRHLGQDRWSYENPIGGNERTTYIYFSDGRVTYVGSADDASAPSQPSSPKASGFKSVGE